MTMKSHYNVGYGYNGNGVTLISVALAPEPPPVEKITVDGDQSPA